MIKVEIPIVAALLQILNVTLYWIKCFHNATVHGGCNRKKNMVPGAGTPR